MKNQETIYDELLALSLALNQVQDPRRLEMYAETLKDYDLKQVIDQIRGFAKTSKFFPQLCEIIGPLEGLDVPADEEATIIASEIIECISRFGPYRTEDVRNHLGEKFFIVERMGGWIGLCQITNDEVPATRAQIRELAKAYINRAKREISGGMSSALPFNSGTLPNRAIPGISND